LQIRFGTQSNQGMVRSSNEDSFAADPVKRLFLVADGMGGHAAGEVASQIAAATMTEVVGPVNDSGEEFEEVLRAAAEAANSRIYETQREKPELAGMGSTLTALTFRDNLYYIAQVGDSRAYLLREGQLEQLTRDHSLVWHLFESGILRKEELSSHPQKNLITRSIGPHAQIEVDIERGDARPGDVYLLCSDGLTDVLSDDDICEILSGVKKSPQEICDLLVDRANQNGGPDNVTAVVVRLEHDGTAEEDSGKSSAS